MSAARRSSLTATAAAAVLGASWFVPTAHAKTGAENPSPDTLAAAESSSTPETAPPPAAAPDTERLTRTGRVDPGSVYTTPRVIAGTALLGCGAAFSAYAIRRDQRGTRQARSLRGREPLTGKSSAGPLDRPSSAGLRAARTTK